MSQLWLSDKEPILLKKQIVANLVCDCVLSVSFKIITQSKNLKK
jgi:hypothetical protein